MVRSTNGPHARSFDGYRRRSGRGSTPGTALARLKEAGRILFRSRAWRPEHGRLVLRQVVGRRRNLEVGFADAEHLQMAASWLARAQDVTGDGGVCGRYRLRGGWTSSYPETTGYLIPTFLALEDAGLSGYRARAGRAAEFLLGLQNDAGAFPAGEVHENTTEPSVFNTAQIIHGLLAWHEETGERRALDAAARAADWLVSVQGPDGSWQKHVYRDVAATYAAHASCWLAELGEYLGVERYRAAARAHLEWVLGHVDPETGWFDRCGFHDRAHGERTASTHTIAYTLWGTLITSQLLGCDRGIEAVHRAAWSIARKLELWRWLPGALDHRWKRQSDYACLTGNAQLAILWFRLFEDSGDRRYLNAALRAIDLVKVRQVTEARSIDLQGAVPGSAPVWGGYLGYALPNWAAKFFIDALLLKEPALDRVRSEVAGGWRIPEDVPRTLPPMTDRPSPTFRTVLYAGPRSAKVEQMVREWRGWGFRPTAVIIEHGASTTRSGSRLWRALRDRGPRMIGALGWQRIRDYLTGAGAGSAGDGPPPPDPEAFCRREKIPMLHVDSLDSPEAVAAVRELRPDLAIHAGAGILRDAILSIPRLGTLNAHMGVLPKYRGMNVTEWAALNCEPIGCSIHFIDPGIDTGAIVLVREVDGSDATTIRELRRMVDTAQIQSLGEAARFILSTGRRPPTREQRPQEGKQYFRMHPELKAILQARLARNAQAPSMTGQ